MADATDKQLNDILDDAGPAYQMLSYKTWAKQAKYAASGKWGDLENYISKNVGNSSSKTRIDDLEILEGIGPKIEQLLYSAGILTFAQLSETSTKSLKAILKAGGSVFQMWDPTSWPKQAKLALDEKWDQLATLQDKLYKGVR